MKFSPSSAGAWRRGVRKKLRQKATGRTLLAGAKHRPAHPPLIVLRFRQGQRQERDVALVGQRPFVDQGRRPGGIARQLAPREAVHRPAVRQFDQAMHHDLGDVLQSRTKLPGFLPLADRPAPRIVLVQLVDLVAPVGFAHFARRRHELRIGRDRIASLRTEPGSAVHQLFPSRKRHENLPVSDASQKRRRRDASAKRR